MSLIQITDLTFAYEGSYNTIFENVNLKLDTNWRLGLRTDCSYNFPCSFPKIIHLIWKI